MNEFLKIFVLPAALAVLSYFIRDTKLTRKMVPVLIWWQLGVVAFVLQSVLLSQVPRIDFGPGLAVDKLGAYFILLTTIDPLVKMHA